MPVLLVVYKLKFCSWTPFSSPWFPLPVWSLDFGYGMVDLWNSEISDAIEWLYSEIPLSRSFAGSHTALTNRAGNTGGKSYYMAKGQSCFTSSQWEERWCNLENASSIQHTGHRREFHHPKDSKAVSKVNYLNGHFFLWMSQHRSFLWNWGPWHRVNCVRIIYSHCWEPERCSGRIRRSSASAYWGFIASHVI